MKKLQASQQWMTTPADGIPLARQNDRGIAWSFVVAVLILQYWHMPLGADPFMIAKEEMEDRPPGSLKLMDTKVVRKFLGQERASSAFTVEIEGDGSCFFRSILYAMDLCGYRGADAKERTRLSRRLREILREEVAFSDQALKEYDDMWKCGKGARKCPWAEQKMIEHTRDVLGCNLVFLDDSEGYRVYCDIAMNFKMPTTVVRWNNNTHFEPMVLVTEGGRIQGVFDPVEDHEIVARIKGAASIACPRRTAPEQRA